jgi:hypothetical protein
MKQALKLSSIKKIEEDLLKLKKILPYEQRIPLQCRYCILSKGANKQSPRMNLCGFNGKLVDVYANICPAKDIDRYKINCAKCKAEIAEVSARKGKDPLEEIINMKHFYFRDNPHNKRNGCGCPSISFDKKRKKSILTFECFCGNDNRTDLDKKKFILTKIKE